MKIIKAKMKGKQPHLVEHVEPQNAEVVDLMERLRQSLQGAGGALRSDRAREKDAPLAASTGATLLEEFKMQKANAQAVNSMPVSV
jgi:hypothetical protein